VVQQGHELAVLSVSVTLDSNFLISTSRDKTAKLWDLRNRREVRSFLGHQASVTAAVFAPDGRILLTGSNDKTVRLWDVNSGKQLWSVTTTDYITDVAIDAQQKFFIHAGYNDTGYGDTAVVRLFSSKEIISKVPVNPNKGTGTGVRVAISPDSKWAAFGEDNRTVLIYETSSWRMVRKLEYPEGYCGGCGAIPVFSHDSKSIFIASHRGQIHQYSTSDFSLLKSFEGEVSDVKSIDLTPDGKYVAMSSEELVAVYASDSGKKIAEVAAGAKGKYQRLRFAIDGKSLFIACEDNTVHQWDFVNNRNLDALSGYLADSDKGGLEYDANSYWESHIARYVRLKNKLVITPDGKSLIKGKFGRKVRRWDIASGRTLNEYSGHRKAALTYDLSKDGKYLVTGGGDGTIILWDALSGDSIRAIRAYREPIFDIHFNKEETKLLSSSWDGTLKIHDLLSGKTETHLDLENSSAYNTIFHPGGLYVFTARLDNSLQMWETDTRTVVRNFIGHTNVVSSLAVTSDEKILLSASWDGTIRLWDVGSGLMIRKLTNGEGAIHAAILGADGKTIFAAGADRLIRIWDLSSGKLLRTLEGHKGEIVSLVISQDGKLLISHSLDGVTKFWNLETNREFYEHVHLGAHDWLVRNREGYFNGTDGARKYIHFVNGLKTYNVDQFFQDYYRPELLPQIFKSRGSDESSKSINNKLKKSPPPLVKVAVLPVDEETANIMVRIVHTGSPVQKLRILHNGKSIALNESELKFPEKEGEFTTYKHEVKLIGGNNTFTAIGTNLDNIESDPRSVELFTESQSKHSVCHVLAIGINEYKNSKLNLNYARPDAVSFSQVLDQKAGALFKSIQVHTLYDKDASRQNILKAMDELSTQVQPEDVFVFYYAGHGSMVDNKFYFIPTENIRLYEQGALQKEAIEASLVQEKLKNIRALKQLIVMDACQSGGSVELLATRGVNEEKAIAQLSRSTGVHVMASAGSEQFAAEFSELGHGLFTYVLLKALEGEADGAPKDGKVTIYELKSYIDDQVPEMTRRMKGKPQYPYTFSRGQDFPVVMKP
jgi:WD40 repeat protein